MTVKNTLIKQGIKKNNSQKVGAAVVCKAADAKSKLHKSGSEASICSNASMTSHASGVISDGCTPEGLSGSGNSNLATSRILPSSARIDLNNSEHAEKFSHETREVLITGVNGEDLTKFNPFRIAKEIDIMCGQVEKVQYLKTGSLLITTNSVQQTKKLLQQQSLTLLNIPVKVTIAWNKLFSYGKIYAPEFVADTVEYLLEILSPNKVVGIRKLYTDPNKAHIPLYVLTFLSKTCPEKIRVGYCYYRVDKYYPSPTRCGKCCHWGHSARHCRSEVVCSNCSKKGHTHAECDIEIPKCCNCGGEHSSFSKECKIYQRERKICQLATDTGIGFAEARKIVCSTKTSHQEIQSLNNRISSHNNASPSVLTSSRTFPRLPQSHTCSQNFTQGRQQIETEIRHKVSGLEPSISQPVSSQDSIWFTQQTKRRKRSIQSREEMSQELLSLDLPELPVSQESHTSSVLQGKALLPSQIKSKNTTEQIDFKKLLVIILPILLKLVLAKQTTEKIACIIEIAELIGAESSISSLISDIDSSPSQE